MLENVIIDKWSALPRHAQIEACFRDLITSGRLAPDQRIPTETEIARALGVSRMTVNKAILTLTREGLFRRERGQGTFVTAKAEVARHFMIVVPTSDTVGSDEQDYYYAPLCRAMQRAARERHHRVSVTYLPRGSYLQAQREWPVDGWLLISPDRRRFDDLHALRRSGAAMVMVGAHWDEFADIPMVDSDNIEGGIAAVRYLHSLGHERIALVYAGPESSNTEDRRAGYRQALQQMGLVHNAGWEIQGDSAERMGSGASMLANLLSLPPASRPTAIFAAGYYLALETLSLAHGLHIAVPERLSLISYDDPFAAQLAYPPLTTLRQPLAEMGHAAVALLDAQLRGEIRGSMRPLFAPEIQIRGSAAPPRKRSGSAASEAECDLFEPPPTAGIAPQGVWSGRRVKEARMAISGTLLRRDVSAPVGLLRRRF